VHGARPKLLALLEDQSIGVLVVTHTDRLTRVGFRSLETLLKTQHRAIEVVNQAENGTADLLTDLTAHIYSFCARRYGPRRAKRTTAKMGRELAARDVQGDSDATD
jgi:putative resolvase